MTNKELTSIIFRPDEAIELFRPELILSQFTNIEPELAKKIVNSVMQPQVAILSDLPTLDDAFGAQSLVKTLGNLLLGDATQTPITVAIDGQWGTGKTTLMKMIERQASLLKYPCIWLNAWNLLNPEMLITSIASKIRDENVKLDDQTNKNLRRPVSFSALLKSWVENARWVFAGSNSSSKLSPAEQVVKGLPSDTTIRAGFEQLVSELFSDEDGRERRLLVFIDDIDRAFPEQIIALFKTIKLILEVPGCVFFLAMDVNTVAGMISQHYNINKSREDVASNENYGSSGITMGAQGFGEAYLDKLIQLKINTPAIQRPVVNKYLDQILIVDEVKQIIYWSPDRDVLNPRRLKQYINWLNIMLQLIMTVPISVSDQNNSTTKGLINNGNLLRAAALKKGYPVYYELALEGNISIEKLRGWPHLRKPDNESSESQQVEKFYLYINTLTPSVLQYFEGLLMEYSFLNQF